MVKLVEYSRTATFAWSQDKVPILATGTASGAVDADFSSVSSLEFWSILSKNSEKPDFVINADAKFNDLDWSNDNKILAGALENGVVEFFDVEHKKSVACISQHTTAVKTLRFNAKQNNLLVSSGNKGEIFVWDTNKVSSQDYSPLVPGTAMTPSDEVESLAWNQSLAHVFASAGSSGFASVWDLKAKKEVLHLSYTSPSSGMKNQLSVVEWHPTNSTRVATATGNDNEPVILVWDLRNANTPLQILSQGHIKRILSLDWCHGDENLMLSSGRDNTSILWNPVEGKKLTEYPTHGSWCFKTKFAPQACDLFATASFDNKIEVQTLQNLENKLDLDETAYKQQESETEFWNNVSHIESIEKPLVAKLQAPLWYGNKSPAAQWAFGGKLVHITPDGKGISVTIPSIEGFEKNTMLDEALRTKNFVPIINKRLAQTINNINEEDWSLLESLSMYGKDTFLTESLSLDDKKIEETPEEQDEDFFDNLTSNVNPMGRFTLDTFCTGLIDNLSCGRLDKAVKFALEKDLLLESMIIALNSDDPVLKKKVKDFYFAKYIQSSSIARILHSISERKLDDLVDNVDVSQWKYVVMAINTYANEREKNDLLIRLGDKLFQEGQRQTALILYLAANSLDKIALVWLRELPDLEKSLRSKKNTLNEAHAASLTEFVERFTVLSSYLTDVFMIKLNNAELISKFLEFVNLTSSSGDFDLTLKFLETLPGDHEQVATEKKRVLIASEKNIKPSTAKVKAAKYLNTTQGPAVPMSNFPSTTYPPVDPAFPLNSTSPNFMNTSAQLSQNKSNLYNADVSKFGGGQPPSKYVPPAPFSNAKMPGFTNAPLNNNLVKNLNNPYAPPATKSAATLTPGLRQYAPQNSNFSATGFASPNSGPQYSKGDSIDYNNHHSQIEAGPIIMSGQTPYLNRNANNGWNDLPEIIKEKKVRAKAVLTAPVAMSSSTGTQSSSLTHTSLPPPPLTRIVSNSSMSGGHSSQNRTNSNLGSGTAPPLSLSARLSRTPSLVQVGPSNDQSPSNLYAPSQQKSSTFTLPPNPYAPSSSTNLGTSNPYGSQVSNSPPPNPYAQLNAPPVSPAPPVRKVLPGSPPKTKKNASTAGKDVEFANQLLNSIQKGPDDQHSAVQMSYLPQTSSDKQPPVLTQETISAIPPEHKPIVDFLTQELERVTPLVPADYTKQLKDCSKRLKILFAHLEKQDLLSEATIQKLHQLIAVLKEQKYFEALAIHVDIATNHAQEAGNWLTGVKRLIGLSEATSS